MLSQQILESTGIRLMSRETKHVRRDIKSLAFLTSSTFNSDMLFKLHKGSKGRFCVKQFLQKQHGIFLLRWGKTMCREETRPRKRAQIRKQLTQRGIMDISTCNTGMLDHVSKTTDGSSNKASVAMIGETIRLCVRRMEHRLGRQSRELHIISTQQFKPIV